MASEKVRIFLSWSKEPSKFYAEAFYDWLPLVLEAAQPWVSSRSLTGGDLNVQIMYGAMRDAKMGISFLCPNNLVEPWMLFEAGVVMKASEDWQAVCPYFFGVDTSNLNPPLANLQGLKSDKEGTYRLIQKVNDVLGTAGRDNQHLREVFEMAWPKLESKYDEIRKLPQPPAPPKKTLEEKVDEIITHTRAIYPVHAVLVRMGEQMREYGRSRDNPLGSMKPLPFLRHYLTRGTYDDSEQEIVDEMTDFLMNLRLKKKSPKTQNRPDSDNDGPPSTPTQP